MHYGADEWIDYVRGLRSDEVRSAMAAHLLTCARCANIARIFTYFAAAGGEDGSPVVPPEVVDAARKLYTPPPDGVWQPPSRVARLVLDQGGAPRRLLFESSEAMIDLLVTVPVNGDPATLTGHLRSPMLGAPVRARIEVCGETDAAPLFCTDTNEWGEFALSCEWASTKSLRIYAADSAGPIELAMDLVGGGHARA